MGHTFSNTQYLLSLLNKHLLSTCYVPDIALGAEYKDYGWSCLKEGFFNLNTAKILGPIFISSKKLFCAL